MSNSDWALTRLAESGARYAAGNEWEANYRPCPAPDGSLVQDPDFTLPSAAGPVQWSLYHHSLETSVDGPWGYGRRSSLDLRLVETVNGSDSVVQVSHEDGHWAYFRGDGSTFDPEPGTQASLEKDAYTGEWTEVRGDTGYAYVFPGGSDVSVLYRDSPTGHRLTFGYDAQERLEKVVEPAGRIVTLGYEAGGRVEYVQDWGDRRNTLSYDANGNLEEIQGPTGCLTGFEYDAQHRLTGITDPEGYATTYEYDNIYRVTSRSVAGKRWGYTYPYDAQGAAQQRITDPLGRVSTVTLDTGGNIVASVDPLGNATSHSYAAGRLTAERNALGAIWTHGYDSAGNRLTTQDPLGHVNTATYDAYNNRTTAKDPLGHVTTYGYGANPERRQVVTVMNALGEISTHGYNAWGARESVEDPLGYRHTWQWNNQGLLEAEINPLGYRTTNQYDDVGNRIARIDPLGNRWSQSFDAAGRVIATENPLGHRRTTIYDSRGLVQAEIDPLGYRTTYEWNAFGSRTARIDALGYRTTWEFNAANELIAEVDPQAYRTTHGYDLAGRRQAIENALGYRNTTVFDAAGQPVAQVDALGYRNTTVFDVAGRAVAQVDALGYRSTAVFDVASRPVAAVDALGNRWTTTHDALGRAVGQEDPLGNRSTRVFDRRGLVEASIDPAGNRTSQSYDATSRLVASQNPKGFRTTYLHDEVGRSVAVENALGQRVTTLFDAAGQTSAVLNARGYRTTFAFDEAGRQMRREDPLGRRWTSVYDAGARIAQTIDPKAQVASMTYSSRGELLETVYADGSRVTSVYDALGRMTVARDRSGVTSQSWDPRGSLATVVSPAHPGGAALTYAFDAVGRRTEAVLGSGRQTFIHDALGRNTVYIDPESGRASWTYDAASRMTEQVNPNGTASTWVYDARSLITGIRHRKSDGSEIGSDQYAWDANGNPLTKRTLGGINTWGYDSLDRLTSEQHELGILATWEYDAAGNRLTQDRTQSGVRTLTNYAYDPADQLLTASEGTAVTTFAFDACGNQTREESAAGIKTMTWEPRNLMTGYQEGAQAAVYIHRYDGLRASIDPGTGDPPTRLLWDPLGPTGYVDMLAETKVSDNSLLRQYWRGARLVTYRDVSNKGVYLFDQLGNSEAILNASETTLTGYLFGAWGEQFGSTEGLSANPLQFGADWGAHTDSPDRALSMRLREYLPSLTRFCTMELDHRADGPNLFAYVWNRPTRFTDPSGGLTVDPTCTGSVVPILQKLIGRICGPGGIGSGMSSTVWGQILACARGRMGAWAGACPLPAGLTPSTLMYCMSSYCNWQLLICHAPATDPLCSKWCAYSKCDLASRRSPFNPADIVICVTRVCPQTIWNLGCSCSTYGPPCGPAVGSEGMCMLLHEMSHGCGFCSGSPCDQAWVDAIACCLRHAFI